MMSVIFHDYSVKALIYEYELDPLTPCPLQRLPVIRAVEIRVITIYDPP